LHILTKAVITYKSWVANELSRQPQERFLEVVVGLGRDIVVLEVLLAVESNCLGLDLSLLDIDLVSGQDDRDVLTDANQITCIEIVSRYAKTVLRRLHLRCQLGTFL